MRNPISRRPVPARHGSARPPSEPSGDLRFYAAINGSMEATSVGRSTRCPLESSAAIPQRLELAVHRIASYLIAGDVKR